MSGVAAVPKVELVPQKSGVRTRKFWQKVVAEFFGTGLFVLLVCGAWIETSNFSEPITYDPNCNCSSVVTIRPAVLPDTVRISFTVGLSYCVLVYSLRYISGGHFNPVVSICAVISKKLSPIRAVIYCVAQILGGVIGAALLYGFTPKIHQGNLGATLPMNAVSQDQAFAVEFFGSLVFLFIITACRDQVTGEDNPPAAHPLIIGLALIIVQLYSIPFSGGGLNPARSFGPALVKRKWASHWVYWFGPVLGGIAGTLIYDFVFSANASLLRVEKCMFANEKSRKNKENEAKHPSEDIALNPEDTIPDDRFDVEIKLENDRPEKGSIELS